MKNLFSKQAIKAEKKKIPFEFVLDLLGRLNVTTKAMFGAYAIYHRDKILLILRDKGGSTHDNGIWVATVAEHHASLRQDFPPLRSITVFGDKESAWQNLPSENDNFETLATTLCELICRGDERIGKIPNSKKKKAVKKPVAKKTVLKKVLKKGSTKKRTSKQRR